MHSNKSPAAKKWAWSKMRAIVKEEMGHLITVQNLLLALKGGEPYLDRILIPDTPTTATTPTRSRKPGPMSATSSPPTRTDARDTR